MSEGIARPTVLAVSVAPARALDLALDHLSRQSHGSDRSVAWLGRLLPKFGQYLENACGIGDVRLVASRDVAAWVDAPLSDGSLPSLSTRHNRRSAAAAGFRILRDLGVVHHDPTLDLDLPDRHWGRKTRPLTDPEVEAGRAVSLRTIAETRLSAVWALAEATATTHEIPHVQHKHVDLDAGTVELSGSSKVAKRTARLTEWGVQILASRLVSTPIRSESLTYEGRGSVETRQASSSRDLVRVLHEAGMKGDPAVKPESVRAWAGRREWMLTGRVESAARQLGCQSLDTAAAIIGYEWADRE